MIERIGIQNFKSLARVDVELGRFTVLIGRNGAGKSSFLQALEVLAWLIRHASINEAFDSNQVKFSDLVFAKAHTRKVSWDCVVSAKSQGDEFRAHYAVEIGKRRHVHVVAESASLTHDSGQPDKGAIEGDKPHIKRVSGNSVVKEGQASLEYHDVAFAHSMLRDVRERRLLRETDFPVLSALADGLAGFRHFQIWGPEPLRRTSTQLSTALSETGLNLSSVVADIKANAPGNYRKLLAEMKRAYAWLDEIEIRGRSAREYALSFLERPGAGNNRKRRVKYSPAQVSDGFLRLLALAALRYQRGHVPILGYEEPENGLHPAALGESVRKLREVAAAGTQVIVTTHSPYLLDYLMDEDQSSDVRPQLKVVLRGQDGKTEILPVDESKLHEAKRQGVGAGELWGLLVDERELT